MGVNAPIEGSNPSFSVRRGGRAVECGGLENRYPSLGGSRVQIPPPPLRTTAAAAEVGDRYFVGRNDRRIWSQPPLISGASGSSCGCWQLMKYSVFCLNAKTTWFSRIVPSASC